jgi:mono/diheme cytochrome c family protein
MNMRKATGWVTAGIVCGWLVVAVQAGFGAEDKSMFDKRCGHCHGKDGQAQTATGKAMHIKPWTGDEATKLQKMSDEDIRKMIVDGVKENGKMRMPPNRGMKEEQLNELVKVVRDLAK